MRLIERGMTLSGSALTPIEGFRNAIRIFHRDIATASRVCSTTPARLLGLNKGDTSRGRDADLIIVDADLNLLYTIVGGQVIFSDQSRTTPQT